jgi:antitoxin (DNA-binding transcriptional repressor) of toxin-antitoxin stability system
MHVKTIAMRIHFIGVKPPACARSKTCDLSRRDEERRYTRRMRTAQVSELKDRWSEVIEAVRNGETVEIRDGDATLAEIVPAHGSRPDPTSLSAHLDQLVREGKAHRGTDTLPADFLTRPLPEPKRSVLEALLEDRHSD